MFWVVALYSDVIGCRRFGGICCVHLQGGGNNIACFSACLRAVYQAVDYE
jgi:hypothetical protein